MKELPKVMSKYQITAVSVTEMAADQQALFEKAVEALLADLICGIDRQLQGNTYEFERK